MEHGRIKLNRNCILKNYVILLTLTLALKVDVGFEAPNLKKLTGKKTEFHGEKNPHLWGLQSSIYLRMRTFLWMFAYIMESHSERHLTSDNWLSKRRTTMHPQNTSTGSFLKLPPSLRKLEVIVIRYRSQAAFETVKSGYRAGCGVMVTTQHFPSHLFSKLSQQLASTSWWFMDKLSRHVELDVPTCFFFWNVLTWCYPPWISRIRWSFFWSSNSVSFYVIFSWGSKRKRASILYKGDFSKDAISIFLFLAIWVDI